MRWSWAVSAVVHVGALVGLSTVGVEVPARPESNLPITLSFHVSAEPIILHGADTVVPSEPIEDVKPTIEDPELTADPEERQEDTRLSLAYTSTKLKRDLPVPLPGNPPPRYPALAQRRGIEGAVLVLLVISEEGKVVRGEIIESSGSSLLDRAALSALSRWRFKPTHSANNNIVCTIMVPIKFRLV